jgi:hypothetical protein
VDQLSHNVRDLPCNLAAGLQTFGKQENEGCTSMVGKVGRSGRKPGKGGKTERFSTRITPDLSKELKASARENRWTVSQTAAFHLWRSLMKRKTVARDDIEALAAAITLTIEGIERTTDERWNANAFTTAAVVPAISFLVSHFGAQGTPTVPAAVERRATRFPADYAAKYREPAEVGEVEAGWVIMKIESRRPLITDGVPPPGVDVIDNYAPAEMRRYRAMFRKLRQAATDSLHSRQSVAPRSSR